ncbi:carboxymuconolactone decarboxylase family protein [Propioniciclava soli]|uniref:carboxymuconolactone decarboxylase family protein n=1 Tax=Propioniciclava soli TaxID=2775081 RepID=UPI001E6156FB|nr:carboxymuconolactone decarboxylase family protein [Propioniciclava soli]
MAPTNRALTNRALTDAARERHDRLFPEGGSGLARTDPEFVEMFVDFAFDRIAGHGSLPEELRLKLILAALIAVGAEAEYRVMLGAALNGGVTPVEAKEIVYQAAAYVGQGRVYAFLHATNDVLTARGVELPLPPQATVAPEDRWQAGWDLQVQIFGDAIQAGYDAAAPDERHLRDRLADNCFGDYQTRSGLDTPTRELLTFCYLVALGGADPQARSHAQGNANVGNDRGVLLDALTTLLPWIGYPRTLNGLAAVNAALPPEGN